MTTPAHTPDCPAGAAEQPGQPEQPEQPDWPQDHAHRAPRIAQQHSLPALNLVTAHQVEVDLLCDPPSPEHGHALDRAHRRLSQPSQPGQPSLASHPPWPHSPSASVASLAAEAAGIYIVLE